MANRKEAVDLKQFVGQGLLSGVWTGKEPRAQHEWEDEPSSENADTMYFMWNGEIYRAQEDPEDGYRSSLGPFQVLGGRLPYDVWDPSERCTCRYVEERIHDEGTEWESREAARVIEFVSDVTGKVVLTIGTLNVGDYYPSCCLHFDPRNLSHNQGLVDLLGRERGDASN